MPRRNGWPPHAEVVAANQNLLDELAAITAGYTELWARERAVIEKLRAARVPWGLIAPAAGQRTSQGVEHRYRQLVRRLNGETSRYSPR